jgi:DNA transformation protein and related proteins
MAISDSFRDDLEIRLRACVPGLRVKRMFGGLGIYAGDAFFAVADNDELFFKTDDGNRGMFEAAGMPAFRPMADRPAMHYHRVPDNVYSEPTRLSEWVAAALDAAARKAKPKKNPVPKKNPRQR